MEQKKLLEIRDRREKGWFWLDNDYFNGFGKILGANAIAIYVALCRHANNDSQTCFPSQKEIAKELNLGERTVRDVIKKLNQHRIIDIEKKRIGGKFVHNVYVLLNKKHWIYPPEATTASGSPEANNDLHQRQPLPPNKTYINKTTDVPNGTSDVGEKKKQETDVQQIVNYFFELKGWANKDKDFYRHNRIIYGRHLRPAKELIGLCEGNLEEAKFCLKKVADWAITRDLSWSIETVFKKWYDIDILKPKEKKPYYNGNRVFEISGRKYVLMPNGEKLQFAGKESELTYK